MSRINKVQVGTTISVPVRDAFFQFSKETRIPRSTLFEEALVLLLDKYERTIDNTDKAM